MTRPAFKCTTALFAMGLAIFSLLAPIGAAGLPDAVANGIETTPWRSGARLSID